MRLLTLAAISLATAAFAGTNTGQPSLDQTEYDAVSADGPYSYLPRKDHVTDHLYVSEQDALMTDHMLNLLSGDPILPVSADTPLDGPALSATSILLAGL